AQDRSAQGRSAGHPETGSTGDTPGADTVGSDEQHPRHEPQPPIRANRSADVDGRRGQGKRRHVWPWRRRLSASRLWLADDAFGRWPGERLSGAAFTRTLTGTIPSTPPALRPGGRSGRSVEGPALGERDSRRLVQA